MSYSNALLLFILRIYIAEVDGIDIQYRDRVLRLSARRPRTAIGGDPEAYGVRVLTRRTFGLRITRIREARSRR